MNSILAWRKSPATFAALLLIFSLAGPVPRALGQEKTTEQTTPREKLPPARQIIDRFVKAIGGEAAFSKMKSQHAKGKVTMAAQGINGDLEVFAGRPNRILVKINLPGVGEIRQGYDGKVAWSIDPVRGPSLLEDKQLEQFKDQADFDSILHRPEDYESMETLEIADFEGKQCYKVRSVKKSGQEITEFYDVKSGLQAGFLMTVESPLGPLSTTNIVEDYKQFGDLRFPTKITQRMGPMEQVMTFNIYEINKVDDSVFALPKEIKALMEK